MTFTYLKNIPQSIKWLGGYIVVINAGSAGLFWYDVYQAKNKGPRVPEMKLQVSALLGGWIGGLWGNYNA